MEMIIYEKPEDASLVAARIVARQVREKPDSVLGLATGSTPLKLYKELIRLHREEDLDFSRILTFNLDEYVGLAPDHPESYSRFMHENLFEHINVPRKSIHIPDGMSKDIPAFCSAYEAGIKEAGGIDLQVLGIGVDGHIGFNEPTSSMASRTRIKSLTLQTRRDNARFFGSEEAVPKHVITMGVGTIMEARMNLLMAFGESKAPAVAEAIEGPITSMIPASVLQLHPVVKVVIDDAAAVNLTKQDYYRWVYDNKPDWQQFK